MANEEKKEVSMTIILREDGHVQVSGPMLGEGSNIFDEPTSFWMMDKAKDIIKFHNKKLNASRILSPQGGGNGNRINIR